MERAELWLCAVVLLSGACVSSTTPSSLGGESHFLTQCEGSCGGELDCIQGLCTRGCVVAVDSCGDLNSAAICTADSVEPGEVAVCDVACSEDADCATLSNGHTCRAGHCRAPKGTSRDASTPADASSAAAPFPTDRVFPCPADADPIGEPFEVARTAMQGDQLTLWVNYSPECTGDAFALCHSETFLESYPVQNTLTLIHSGRDEPCLGYVAQPVSFDLSPLATYYEASYQSDAGLISTNFGLYAFGPLSCDDRDVAAAGQVQDLVEGAPRGCLEDSDCTWLYTGTDCTAGCGTAVSTDVVSQMQDYLDGVSTDVCRDYEADGCGPVLQPPCPSPPTLSCLAGACIEGAGP